jgi:hypothetical protein
VKREAVDHPKLWELAEQLEGLGVPAFCSIGAAAGYLERLWAMTAKHAPDGRIGRYSPKRIAHFIGWGGDPTEFIDALAGAEWVDGHGVDLMIHDWSDHADRHVHRALIRSCQRFADGSLPNLSYADQHERLRWKDPGSPPGSPPGSHYSTPTGQPAEQPAGVEPEPEPSQSKSVGGDRGGDRSRQRSLTTPPEALKEEELAKLATWAQDKWPAEITDVREMAEEMLEWYRAKGKRAKSWYAAAQTWIRRSRDFKMQEKQKIGGNGRSDDPNAPARSTYQPSTAEEYAEAKRTGAKAKEILRKHMRGSGRSTPPI